MSEADYSRVREDGDWLGRTGLALAALAVLLPIILTVVAFVWIIIDAGPALDTG
jgi:hypothetical protein